MRKWMFTMIAGATIALTFAPDPAAAAWGWRHAWGWGGPGFAVGSFYRPYAYYGSPYAYYGSAYAYGFPYRYYGYGYGYDCMGGRDSSGVTC
jgi:hypothetical protein